MLLRNICIILIKWWKKYIFSEKYLPAQYKLEKKSTSIASCFPKYLGNPYDYEETTNFIQVLILSILSLFGVINVFAFSVFEIFEFSLFKFFSNFIVTTYTDKIILMWLLFELKMGFFCSYYVALWFYVRGVIKLLPVWILRNFFISDKFFVSSFFGALKNDSPDKSN